MPTENKNKDLVVAMYEDRTRAKEAQKSIQVWDKAEESIKLGSTAVIYKGPDSQLHWERGGVKDWKASALVAGVIGVILSGGVLLLAGLGAAVGGIDTKRLGIPKEDIEAIGTSLDQGKAALAVLCDDYEVEPLSAELTRLGGTITTVQVPQEVVSATDQHVQTQADAGQVTEQSTQVAEITPATEPLDTGSQTTTPNPPQA
jgi:uncharacterized membrane protein